MSNQEKRIAQRLRTKAISEQARHREMRQAIDAELRDYRLLAPKLSAGASEDVVTQYLRRQAETYGIGYIPPDLGGSTTKERFCHMVNETCEVVRDLFGPSWKAFVGHVGLNATVLRTLRLPSSYVKGGSKKGVDARPTAGGLANVRLAQLTLLVHINGIRETLTDYERKLWVLLQRSHDPSFTGEDASTSRMAVLSRGRQHIREGIGQLLKSVPKPYYLPLRALATLEYPHVTTREATVLKYHDMIEARELTTAWLSQKSYDGMQDLEACAPVRRDNEEYTHLPAGTPRKPRKRRERENTAVKSPKAEPERRYVTWYHEWQANMRETHGYTWRFLRNRKRWTKEIWDSYTAARERAHLRKQINEKGELVYEAKQTVRSIEAYLQEMRQTREREKRQFLSYLNKHAGKPLEAERLLNEYFEKSAEQEKELPIDALVERRSMGFKHIGYEPVRAKDLSKDPKVLAAKRHREWLLQQIMDPDYERERDRNEIRDEMRKRDLDPYSKRDRETFKHMIMREQAKQLQAYDPADTAWDPSWDRWDRWDDDDDDVVGEEKKDDSDNGQ